MVQLKTVLFFLILVLCCTCQEIQHKVEVTNPSKKAADQINVESIYHALAMPLCIRKCTNGLLQELKAVLRFEDVYESLQYLCSEYESASDCMEVRHCPHINIYDIATSGLKSLCIGRKHQFMLNNEECLKNNLDASAQTCDKECFFVQAIADFSSNVEDSNGYVQLLQHTSPFCSTGKCFWPCFRDKMNANCSKSGGILMEVILKPFYYLAEYVETGGSIVQKFIQEKLPSTCIYLTKKASLDAIKKTTNNDV